MGAANKSKIRVCKECGSNYVKRKSMDRTTFYCSTACKDIVRKRARVLVNKNNKNKTKLRMLDPVANKESLLKAIYSRYRNGANKRGLEFNISIELMDKYFRADCYYCGVMVHIIGLDRVDNSIGYVDGNIVSCCEECNRMKRVQSQDDFIKRCRAISMNHNWHI